MSFLIWSIENLFVAGFAVLIIMYELDCVMRNGERMYAIDYIADII